MTWLESSDRRWARSGSAHPASVQKIVVRYSLPGERKRRAESKKASRQRRCVDQRVDWDKGPEGEEACECQRCRGDRGREMGKTWLSRCV